MLISRKFSGATFALVAAIIGTSFVVAQDVTVTKPGAPAHHHYRAKQILGSKMHIEGNTAIGTIDDIVFDQDGNVDYIIVAKADETLVTVPWDAAVFNVDRRIVEVNITPERFQQVPTYTVKQYPIFSTPTYRTQVYKYYGLTPAQERRVIRRNGTVVVP